VRHFKYFDDVGLKDGQLHGPVHLIVADDGRMGLHCSVDDQSWDLPQAHRLSSSAPRADDGQAEAATQPRPKRSPELNVINDEFSPRRTGRTMGQVERFARTHFK
jgi:hypothetical protein